MASTEVLPRSRRRRVLRVVLIIFGVLVLIAGGVTYWALDRFVIDHVEINDVAAYEQAVKSTTTTIADSPAAFIATTTVATTAQPTTTVPVTEPPKPLFTDDSFVRGGTSIKITKVVTGTNEDTVTYFVADVVLADSSELRSGFAENKFGRNIIADTSDIARSYDAVFAINGDYYGFRESGLVIRNGVIFRDKPARTGLAMYANGTMAIYDEKETTADELIAVGVLNTLSFGPALVDDGAIVGGIEQVEVDTNFGNHSIQGNQPRTGLGMIEANHFVFIVADGRSPGYSEGVTMTEFAQLFIDLGATVAYNLDGGGSATMYFNGQVVNNPLGRGRERGTSDILYIS
jgi:hypothetical protein